MAASITVSILGKITFLSLTYLSAINIHGNSEIALLCLHTYNMFLSMD
jgi:hypothetical protein